MNMEVFFSNFIFSQYKRKRYTVIPITSGRCSLICVFLYDLTDLQYPLSLYFLYSKLTMHGQCHVQKYMTGTIDSCFAI